ncbi:MAG: sulfate permease [Gemmatimonadota bacterium]|nr:sulfate permease [Gemmatimonadota bacterium]
MTSNKTDRSKLPAPDWLRSYRRADLPGDLSAGVTVAVMLIPQGMAYAMLAGLPPVVGLYASTIPLFVYALLGSSRQLAVGPVAIVSLLTLSGISAVAEPGSGEFIALAALLALLAGTVQLGLGLLRAGFIVNFLSHAVISGFTSAAAIVIGLSQLKELLGIELASRHSVFALIQEAALRIGETNPYTLAIGLASIAALIVAKKRAPRLPAALVVVLVATVATWALGLADKGVAVVGAVPGGFPAPSLPMLDPAALTGLLGSALTISFVGFVESFAVAKSIATREKYKIDANRELKALGLANVATALFSGFPVTGGFSRSAVNYQSGARTPLASIVTGVLILVTVLAFTSLFHYLPTAVLAAVVVVAVYGLVDVRHAVHLFQLKKVDGWTLVITFVATLVLGIETGILVGVGFSLLVFIWRSAYPHWARLGYLVRARVFRNVERFPEVRTYPGVLILRVDASLYFANMTFLEDTLRSELLERPDCREIILDFSGVNDMDAVAVETLEILMQEMRSQGVTVRIAAMKGPVRDVTTRAGWPDKFGERIGYFSIERALEAVGIRDLDDSSMDASSVEHAP